MLSVDVSQDTDRKCHQVIVTELLYLAIRM